MLAPLTRRTFTLVLIKPSHYDDDGYVIQWMRSAIPSNTLAVLNGLALDCRDRRCSGGDVDIDIHAIDETNTRIRPDRIASDHRGNGGLGLVALVGVQSNQFPRAIDIARRLRAGRHPGRDRRLPRLRLPRDAAGDAARPQRGARRSASRCSPARRRGASTQVLRDAYAGALKPLYNFMNDLPGLEGAPMPMLPAERIERTGGRLTSFDAGRGCPFQCSFCTIINVQGRKSRYRTADDVEAHHPRATWRRASTTSSSPTTISPATGTGSRSSTG